MEIPCAGFPHNVCIMVHANCWDAFRRKIRERILVFRLVFNKPHLYRFLSLMMSRRLRKVLSGPAAGDSWDHPAMRALATETLVVQSLLKRGELAVVTSIAVSAHGPERTAQPFPIRLLPTTPTINLDWLG